MGAMPFSELFKGRFAAKDSARGEVAAYGPSFDREDKRVLIDALEADGIAQFWACDGNARLTYLSPTILDAVGKPLEDLMHLPLQALFTLVDGEGDGRSLALRLGTRKAFHALTVRTENAKRPLTLRLSGRPHFDGSTFAGFRGTALDITAEFEAEEAKQRLTQFDALTGLANRPRMEQRIDSTLAAFRSAKRNAALMMLDLDRFKQVNDTLGHAAGDELLQQVAERLTTAVAARGEIGRLGGDEFQVLIPDMDDRGELGEMAKRIIQMLSQPYSLRDGRCTIGCSVGVAIAPFDGLERDELTRAADLALYASKNGGRGQFRFYAGELEHEANLRKRMQEDLAEAVENGSFKLEYRPIVTIDDNKVVAVEAEYVWEDEERGRVEQHTFLPVAEGSRLIVPIGEWALRKACEDALTWSDALNLQFKVTPIQFAANGFADTVIAVLKDTGFPAARLELQLRESTLQGDASAVDQTLSALFKHGVRLTLDDFGNGFTALGYLRRAPFNTIRIGSAFFEPTLGHDHGDMSMVRAVVALADAMGMKTAASGVHSLDLLHELADTGVTYADGYAYSEPLPADVLAGKLSQGEWSCPPSQSGAQRAQRRTVFRRIGVIHEDHYYEVTLRNLSRSGAMIEGLMDVPVGTMFVLDFGQGQLAVGRVKRVMDDTQGIEFEQDLVDDGAGGLCTRHRVSPYDLAAAGAPLTALPPGKYAGADDLGAHGFAQFKLSANAPKQGCGPD